MRLNCNMQIQFQQIKERFFRLPYIQIKRNMASGFNGKDFYYESKKNIYGDYCKLFCFYIYFK